MDELSSFSLLILDSLHVKHNLCGGGGVGGGGGVVVVWYFPIIIPP